MDSAQNCEDEAQVATDSQVLANTKNMGGLLNRFQVINGSHTNYILHVL